VRLQHGLPGRGGGAARGGIAGAGRGGRGRGGGRGAGRLLRPPAGRSFRPRLFDPVPGKAEAAAEAVRSSAAGTTDIVVAADVAAALAGASGICQCSPVGMVGHEGMPFAEALLDSTAEGAWLLECVYTPVETELVSTARRRGMQTITGDRCATPPITPCQCQCQEWPHRVPAVLPSRFSEAVEHLLGCLKGSADNSFCLLVQAEPSPVPGAV